MTLQGLHLKASALCLLNVPLCSASTSFSSQDQLARGNKLIDDTVARANQRNLNMTQNKHVNTHVNEQFLSCDHFSVGVIPLGLPRILW